MSIKDVKHPKGYWMGVGICIGIAPGVALGAALENIGAGIAIGIALGAGIGASLEQRNKDNLRPLTGQEQKRQKWGIIVGLALASIMAVILIAIYFLLAR